jgi:hypothetical protein
MSAEIVVALIASFSGLLVALAGVPVNYWIASRTRRLSKFDVMIRYRDPLLWAAFDLNSRIYNLLTQDFIAYWHRGSLPHRSDQERHAYITRSTLFVVAEYLGWSEAVRRNIQFLDLGSQARNRRLMELLFQIQKTFAADVMRDPRFCLFRSDQRAIGELMMVESNQEVGSDRCIGYATFCTRLDEDPAFAVWFASLEEDVEAFANRPNIKSDRLVRLQNQLIDLIDFLDPKKIRFPEEIREKLDQTYAGMSI